MNTHVAVVGAYGSAGVAAAERLRAEEGVELTLIDDGEPGGLCILRGCMPSKEVLSAGAHRFGVTHDHRLEGDPTVDLEAVVETKDEHVQAFAEHRGAAVEALAEESGVRLLEGQASFADEETLVVDGERIPADYIVIATGSTVNVPATPGIETVEYMTSRELLDATSLPDTGIVMGFGAVGMEMAPYLTEACGMELTVIEHDERPLDRADASFGDALLEIYREQFGIDIRTNVYEESLEQTDDGVALTLTDGSTIEADQLFCFTGRRPQLDGLALENAGMDTSPGWVDATMQARDNEAVFVVGDANGKEPILHVAKEQAYEAAENILGLERGEAPQPYTNTHHEMVFSGLGTYPFARVGHTAHSAREAGLEPVVATRAAADDGVFKTKDAPAGLARLVAAPDGTVLGYQGLHYHADVMAKSMQMAVEMELDARDIPDRAYHPTTPEILDGLLRSVTDQLA